MEYKTKKIYCGKYLEIDIIPTLEEKQISKNGKKVFLTPDKQKNLNDKNARRYFCQLLNTNFNSNDLHITLTYNDYFMPSSYDEANKIAYNYIRRLKNKYKKQNKELKYVLVTEYTTEETEGEIRIHHHIILNKIFADDLYTKMWSNKKKPIGRSKSYKLDFNETGIEGLAKYLTKNKGQKKRWSCSQNLDKPFIRERKIRLSKTKVSKLVFDINNKGIWEIDNKGYIYTDSNSVYNEITGLWHFYIRMRKIE
ncbi:MAG: hypothetical protein KIC92_09460 [Clostridiales bacterium]|nr:hypothetical protein [Clostridiales bacterium]